MKKTYFAPVTDITTIELQQMMASSPGTTTLNKDEDPIDDSEKIGSRRRSLWDDED